jgi:hypothetical protein
MREIRDEKKSATFSDLFADEKAKDFILYNNFCQPNQYFDFDCSNFIDENTNGFMALKS